jgi:glucose/arabinose dehydrogenase
MSRDYIYSNKKDRMKRILILILMITICANAFAFDKDSIAAPTTNIKADANNAGLTLPSGFGALVFAGGLGKARHISVTPQGDVYVKLDFLYKKAGIYFLHDGNGDGKADVITGFGNFTGTGMVVKNGYLYATSNTEVFRYKLDANGHVINPAQPEKIITGLIARNEHEAKAITLDDAGNIYVVIGAFSNACQVEDRTAGSPGIRPCPVLDSAAGIWKFRVDKLNQGYGNGVRYATGLRNVVGLDWNKDVNALFVMQHGRDQLHDLFPKLYDEKMSSELPAECLYRLKQGDDAGWPYIYYDELQNKKMVMPEYGGDGKKTGGANAIDPLVAFSGHMAPNGLLFYTGSMFPEKYRHGAFIAFHGSWNRTPVQAGYCVMFVPFKDGKPSGKPEVFANGFAGMAVVKSPGNAKHRPCGLAQGPDGSLYVSDDQGGNIYRIIYTGK